MILVVRQGEELGLQGTNLSLIVTPKKANLEAKKATKKISQTHKRTAKHTTTKVTIITFVFPLNHYFGLLFCQPILTYIKKEEVSYKSNLIPKLHGGMLHF